MEVAQFYVTLTVCGVKCHFRLISIDKQCQLDNLDINGQCCMSLGCFTMASVVVHLIILRMYNCSSLSLFTQVLHKVKNCDGRLTYPSLVRNNLIF